MFASAAMAQPDLAGQLPSVRFSVFSERPLRDVAFLSFREAPQTAEFHSSTRSRHYEYRGPMPLRFFDPISREVVAEVMIPQTLRDVLLLFLPVGIRADDSRSQLRYQVAVIDDSTLRNGPGGLVILNLSGLDLSGTIDDKSITLRAGLNPTVTIARSVNVNLRAAINGRSHPSFANTLQVAPSERALLILFPPFYKGSHEVQSRVLLDSVSWR